MSSTIKEVAVVAGVGLGLTWLGRRYLNFGNFPVLAGATLYVVGYQAAQQNWLRKPLQLAARL